MASKIRVSILDDHQATIDGYIYRLDNTPGIEVVATALTGEELEPMLSKNPTDLLILDVQVPTSTENRNLYPIQHVIPKLLKQYKDLLILVISMHNRPALIKTIMDAGANGYILKDDYVTIQKLGSIIIALTKDGVHLSSQVYEQLFKKTPDVELTPRQQEALALCAAYPEATLAELSQHMGIVGSTIRNILSDAYERLNVRTKAAAISKAQQLGIITPQTPPIDFDDD